ASASFGQPRSGTGIWNDGSDDTMGSKQRDSGKPSTSSAAAGAGRYAYEGLDRLIHERARLAILSSLASNESGLTFNDLKDLCALTDGNLSRQLQMLKEA